MRLFVLLVAAIVGITWWVSKDRGDLIAEGPGVRLPVRVLAATSPSVDVPRGVAIDWQLLRGMDYRAGNVNAALKAMDGRQVELAGFMVPLEDDPSSVSEFLLVPVLGSCIHTPPPPPNQIVQVRVASETHARVEWEETVLVQGKLSLSSVASPFGPVGFQMTDARVIRNQ